MQLSELLPDPDIEIYKIYVESAEKNIDRRLQSNRYFFSLVGAIFASYVVIGQLKETNQAKTLFDLAESLMPIFLLILSVAWLLSVRAFRALSKAKYSVIAKLESNEKFKKKPFTDEWKEHDVNYFTGTRVEMSIPILFIVISLIALAPTALTLAENLLGR